MLFQKTQICFNKPDHVTVHSVMNIMTANGKATKMFLSYFYLALVGKGLLQAHSLIKLLSIYFHYLFYLTTVNQSLTIFFSKNDVSLERSPSEEVKKKHQTTEKVGM